MSDILNWATLDNTDAIKVKDRGVDITLGLDDGLQYNLLKSEEFKSIQIYSIEEADGMYDSWDISVAANNIKPGNYYGFKISASYFKSGTISEINLLSKTNNDARKFNKLCVAKYIDGVYTVVDYGDVEYFNSKTKFDDFYTQEKAGKDWGRTKINLRYGLSTLTDDTGYNILADSSAAILIFAPVNLDDYPINKTFTHDEFESICQLERDVRNATPSGTEYVHVYLKDIRVVNLYRSLKDASSFMYETNGSNSAPDYIPYLWYKTEINVIKDHVESNYKRYHLDADSVSEISLLKYSAPFIHSINKINTANITWKEIYISDLSLRGITYSDSRRKSKMELNSKTISKIQIPLNFKYPWLSGFKNYYTNGMEDNINKDYGILYLPMALEISIDGENWIRSSNVIAQNSPRSSTNYREFLDTMINWEFDFNEPIAYKGNGIWLRVYNIERDYFEDIDLGPSRLNVNELAISYYQAATSSNDYIIASKYNTSTGSKDEQRINVTAPVKIFFDYELRSTWSDLVENHIYENEYIKYDTFDTNKVAIENNCVLIENDSNKHHASTWTLNGIYSPVTNDEYFLNTITLYSNSDKNPSLDNNQQYYLMIELANGKKYFSTNALYINNDMTGIIPTWIFDENDEIKLIGGELKIGLVRTNNPSETFNNIGQSGINLVQYVATGTGCSMSRGGTQPRSAENLGSIYFGFRYNKVLSLEKRISMLESLILNNTSN